MITIVSSNNKFTQEAKLWESRVLQNGGHLQWNSVFIANEFIRALRTKSYYLKIKYLLPMLGVGIGAAMVPLIDTQNFGIPTNVNFIDADFNQATGLKGNASDKRLTMPFKPSELGESKNGGVGFWSLNVSLAAGTQYAMGMFTSGGGVFGLRFGNSEGDVSCEFYWGDNPSNNAALSEVRSNSHYYGNRGSSISRILYKNGIQVGSNTTSDDATQSSERSAPSYAVDIISNIVAYWGGSKAIEYYTDGTMTNSEALDFHSLILNYLMIPTGRSLS